MIAQRFRYDISTQLIVEKARMGKFTSFSELTRLYGIADQDWAFVYTLIFQHLNIMVSECWNRQLPCFPVMVVAKKHLKSGDMSQRQIERLSKAMLKVGYRDASNMQQIRMHQASCHNWAVLNKHNFHDKVLDDGLVIPQFPPSPPMGREVYRIK
ncbi:MAG: hypothetical protein ACON4W_03805 [Parvibaculales bacterium]